MDTVLSRLMVDERIVRVSRDSSKQFQNLRHIESFPNLFRCVTKAATATCYLPSLNVLVLFHQTSKYFISWAFNWKIKKLTWKRIKTNSIPVIKVYERHSTVHSSRAVYYRATHGNVNILKASFYYLRKEQEEK